MSVQPKMVPLVAQASNRLYDDTKDAKLINCIVEKPADEVIRVEHRPGVVYAGSYGSGGTSDNRFRGALSYQGFTIIVNGGVFRALDDSMTEFSASLIDTDYIGTPQFWMAGLRNLSNRIFVVAAGAYHVYLWSYNSFGFTEITSTITAAGATLPLMSGVTVLNGTVYVMDSVGRIFGSNVMNPSTWNALNYVSVASDTDKGLMVAKQGTRVLGFKNFSIDVFYDNGAAQVSGSPLAKDDTSKITVFGMASPRSLVDFGGVLIWHFVSKAGRTGVALMDGLQPKIISTPAIERLIINEQELRAFTASLGGHTYYIGTTTFGAVVYDLTVGLWYVWYTVNGDFPWAGSVTRTFGTEVFGTITDVYLLSQSSRDYYVLQHTTAQDDLTSTSSNTNFVSQIVTPRYDEGVAVKKQCSRTEIMGDVVPGLTFTIECSDDDYASWTAPRQVNMALPSSPLPNCGTFRRRAWRLTTNSGTGFRVTGLQLHVALGSS